MRVCDTWSFSVISRVVLRRSESIMSDHIDEWNPQLLSCQPKIFIYSRKRCDPNTSDDCSFSKSKSGILNYIFAGIKVLKNKLLASLRFNFLECTNKHPQQCVTREALLINGLSRIMRVIRGRLTRVKIGSRGRAGGWKRWGAFVVGARLRKTWNGLISKTRPRSSESLWKHDRGVSIRAR